MHESLWDAAVGFETIINNNLRIDLLFLLKYPNLLGFVPARLLVHYDSPILPFGRLLGKVFPSLFLLTCLFRSSWNSLLLPTRMHESLWDAAVGFEAIINNNLRIDLLFLLKYPNLLGFVPARLLVHYDGPLLPFGHVFPFLFLLTS